MQMDLFGTNPNPNQTKLTNQPNPGEFLKLYHGSNTNTITKFSARSNYPFNDCGSGLYTTLEKAVGDLWGITSSEVGYNYELTLDITQLRELPNLKIVYLGNGRDSLVTWFLMLVAYRRYAEPIEFRVKDLSRINLGSVLGAISSTAYENVDYINISQLQSLDCKIMNLGLLEYLDNADIIVLPRVDSSFYSSVQGLLLNFLDLEDLYKIFTVTLEGDNPLGYQVFLKSQRVFDCIIETKCLDIEITPALSESKVNLDNAKQYIKNYIATKSQAKNTSTRMFVENTKTLRFTELMIDDFIGGNYGT